MRERAENAAVEAYKSITAPVARELKRKLSERTDWTSESIGELVDSINYDVEQLALHYEMEELRSLLQGAGEDVT